MTFVAAISGMSKREHQFSRWSVFELELESGYLIPLTWSWLVRRSLRYSGFKMRREKIHRLKWLLSGALHVFSELSGASCPSLSLSFALFLTEKQLRAALDSGFFCANFVEFHVFYAKKLHQNQRNFELGTKFGKFRWVRAEFGRVWSKFRPG